MNLIERERELTRLTNLFSESQAGRGRVAVVSGTVGAGKTALLHTFAETATASDAFFLSAAATPGRRKIPLGVVRQIFRGIASLPCGGSDVTRLLDEAMGAAFAGDDFSPIDITETTGAVLQKLNDVLLTASRHAPLVIGIDDAHHADTASLQFLLYAAHRVRSARVLMVLNEPAGPWQEHPAFNAELLSLPHSRHIRLRPLSRRGQARLLAPRFGDPAGHRLAMTWQAITGGNPLLAHALLEDNRHLVRPPDQPLVDAAYTQALLTCLRRGGPAMVAVARALAVLEEPAPSRALLGRLLDMDAEHVRDTIELMNRAGLLGGGRWRHPAARAGVLDSIAPGERSALHGRAARLLHEHGAAPAVVAGQLVAVGDTEAAWAVPVLEEAAEQALAARETHTALSCLRLAHRTDSDERQRARITSALAGTEWRIDPSAAGRLLPALVSAACDGLLTGRHTARLLGHLMWCGRVKEAAGLLVRLTAPGTPRPIGASAHLEAVTLLMSCVYPDVVRRAAPRSTATAGRRDAAASADRRVRAASALSAVLTGASDRDVIATAEQVLQGTRLGEQLSESPLAALAALVYADRPDQAATWCDPLLTEAATRREPVAHAVLAAARAVISIRQGDPAGAERHARTALTRISPASWGVAIGLPLSVMVLAATALGRFEDAATYLDVPVPEATFQSPCGLHYLQARGRYHLATGHPAAALADFEHCGGLMTAWGFDRPGLITWRSDAAQALIALGDAGRAVELIEAQLALVPPGPSRTRGISLRVRGMAAEGDERNAWLQEAVDVLEQSGDRYESALAAGELGRTRNPGAPGDRAPDPEPDARDLTEAESRIATLAAEGWTNRQIADKLLITVSTVEQHLTRVYRKLQVNRRTDLRARLRGDG
ncbi:AAA family ATPase [Actinomadura rugatobispora]|uniref:AAA family ATPase n=1 Tax=Actinomadura rugatobispora TaxID=1994 RepID=A0ABW1ADR6_9ACTN